jgi:patatin-like phospholipase/acyl hydrolase
MSTPTVQANGLNLLSRDGGGVRGLSALQILKHLMEQIDYDNPPKPCNIFDMIAGTSTGGCVIKQNISVWRMCLSVLG